MPNRMKPLAAFCLLTGCAASLPQAPVGQPDERAQGRVPAAPDRSRLAGAAAQTLAETLFNRFHERIVESREHRSGPGAVLSHISLYERPQTTHLQGLCEVTVHDVGVPFAAPPGNPPLDGTWVRTGTRYFSIGEVGPSIPPASQESDCAGLPTATHFFAAPSRETAHAALQTYWSARRWAASGTREAVFECTALNGPCPAARTLFSEMLTPDLITSVEEGPCEPGRPGRGTRCFTYHIDTHRSADPSGPWTVSIKGPERPVHVRVTQSMYPVS